jgi:hypothetical protein
MVQVQKVLLRSLLKKFTTAAKKVPVIVSNKHILEDTTAIILTLHRTDNNNIPIPNTISTIRISLDPNLKYFLHHPNNAIDLSIFPFGKLINDLYHL